MNHPELNEIVHGALPRLALRCGVHGSINGRVSNAACNASNIAIVPVAAKTRPYVRGQTTTEQRLTVESATKDPS